MRLNRKAAQAVKRCLEDKITQSISELQKLNAEKIDCNKRIPEIFEAERDRIYRLQLNDFVEVFFVPEKGLNARYQIWVSEHSERIEMY